MTPNTPEELDWIKVRSECTVALIFEKLFLEIKHDVEQVNSANSNRQFKIVRDSGYFTVYQEGLLIGNRSVVFKRDQESIEVSFHSTNKEAMVARIMVNDYGKCCLRVKDRERCSWQFRKDALEDLLFGAQL